MIDYETVFKILLLLDQSILITAGSSHLLAQVSLILTLVD